MWAGDGVLYVSLALQDASALLPCPPGKLLNRYVRGALTGLRALGYPAHYFGRDFISLDALPVAYVAWAAQRSGVVQIELFIAHRRSFVLPAEHSAYPEPSEPPFRGRVPTTLEEHKPCPARDALHAIANGYTRAFHVEARPLELGRRELERAEQLEPMMRCL